MSLLTGISAIGYLTCLTITVLAHRYKKKISKTSDLFLLGLTTSFSVLLIKEYLSIYSIKEGSSLVIILCVFALVQVYSIVKSTIKA